VAAYGRASRDTTYRAAMHTLPADHVHRQRAEDIRPGFVASIDRHPQATADSCIEDAHEGPCQPRWCRCAV